MKKIVLLITSMLMIGFASATMAEQNFPRLFSGLWEGVDTNDGSLTQRSITCNNNGNCQILGSDNYWVFCGNLRGMLSGEGFQASNRINVQFFTLTCNDNGRTVTVSARYTYNPFSRTLVETTDNPAISSITFHKVSR